VNKKKAKQIYFTNRRDRGKISYKTIVQQKVPSTGVMIDYKL